LLAKPPTGKNGFSHPTCMANGSCRFPDPPQTLQGFSPNETEAMAFLIVTREWPKLLSHARQNTSQAVASNHRPMS